MASFIINVTFDCADPRALARFWAVVTGYEQVEASDDRVRLHAPDRRGVRHLLFNRVPEPKRVKNRVHVDLAAREAEAEVRRLVGLGATAHQHVESEGRRWTLMTDPEGNEFCVG